MSIFVFACFVLLFVLTVHLYWSFVNAGNTLSQSDVVTFGVITAIVFVTTSFFGWLGFSSGGRALLQESAEHPVKPLRIARLIRVLVASAGMATGTWLILIVLSLYISGPDLVSMMFLPWVLGLLTVL
ncbi:MAG: hypothetical protein V3V86_09435, partial [Gammaproteobacteria bacterium]